MESVILNAKRKTNETNAKVTETYTFQGYPFSYNPEPPRFPIQKTQAQGAPSVSPRTETNFASV